MAENNLFGNDLEDIISSSTPNVPDLQDFSEDDNEDSYFLDSPELGDDVELPSGLWATEAVRSTMQNPESDSEGEQLESEFEDLPCKTEVTPSSESIKKLKTFIIDGYKIPIDIAKEASDKAIFEHYNHVRQYTNEAKFEKIIFKKPKEIGKDVKKTIITYAAICVGAGGFVGAKANSYFLTHMSDTPDVFTCMFKGFTDDKPFQMFPILPDIFGYAFAIVAGALAMFFFMKYTDQQQRERDRVGHEHGNAHFGTPADFKQFKVQFMEQGDNNMLFGKFKGEELGLSLNNKKVNRSANVLVIGGTGTGKTFKYIKPNLLQENCSVVVTDPSGDIFRSFAPYLMSKGYNVFLFNASDFTLSNHYNPLLNVYDSYGNIQETQVDVLVDLYMKNAKAGKEQSGGDPFWDKSEKAFLTALIYYTLENDEIPKKEKCFNKILRLVQMAKVSDDDDEESPLTQEMNAWFAKMDAAGKPYKAKLYYDTFLIAPQKTANTILITTAVDLQIFSTEAVDFITRLDEDHPAMNIDIDKMATQQSYLFLGIPQSHQAYNFLIAMLYSQLYGRLYELGERKLRGKYHIGYKPGFPVFDYFDTEEQARAFYETVTKENIIEQDYINPGAKVYDLMWNNGHGYKSYKTCFLREPMEKFIDDLKDMVIWNADDYAGGDPSLPIHINFLLDEFKNIGEIPNFLTILSTSRKYRIGSHCVIQDIGQIKTMYKDGEHET